MFISSPFSQVKTAFFGEHSATNHHILVPLTSEKKILMYLIAMFIVLLIQCY